MEKRLISLALFSVSLFGYTVHASASGYGRSNDFVYVETNIKTPNGNSIAAFSRGSDGTLTPVPGSPFLTGGSGTQYNGVDVGPADSDEDIAVNSDRTLLFAVNSGSDSIAVFRIQNNGALTAVQGSPFPSGGSNPVSLSLSGNTLFVVNKSGDFGRTSSVLPNYTALLVLRDGRLVPSDDSSNDGAQPRGLPSTVSVAVGSSPAQAHLIPDTNLLIGIDFLGGLIERFQYDWNGGLLQLPPLALPASEFADTSTPRLPLGVWHHPNRPLLYVGLVTANKLGVYRYNRLGGLQFIRAVNDAGQALCWIRTNRAGTRLYATDTITNSVSVYDLSNPENPVQIQSFVLADPGNVLQFSLSTDEQYLYALSSRGSAAIPEGQGNELHILSIANDGRVSEDLPPVVFHLPNDTRPQGVAVVSLR